jgi:hypothetical protein
MIKWRHGLSSSKFPQLDVDLYEGLIWAPNGDQVVKGSAIFVNLCRRLVGLFIWKVTFFLLAAV